MNEIPNKHNSEEERDPKMKTMLVFPPDWFPSEPYLSLPTLAAYLRSAGHEVVQKDVNLEMYDWFFSRDFLELVLTKKSQTLRLFGNLRQS